MTGHLDPSILCRADLLMVFEKFVALVQGGSTEVLFKIFFSFLFKCKPFALYLLAQNKVKLPDAGLPSASGCQKPGKQMFCFLFAGPVRTQRLWEGVSKPKERSASIRLGPGHCSGRGWAQPAPMLALADAGA